MKDSDIPNGSHVWAVFDAKLCVLKKEGDNCYFIADAWECSVDFNELKVISIIPSPSIPH